MSERDGWNHLYLYDAATGQVKNQITRGEWVVRGVDRVDEETRQIWFRAGGIVPGAGPVSRPLLPRELRRHGLARAHRGRRHAHRGSCRPTGAFSSTRFRASICRRCTSCAAPERAAGLRAGARRCSARSRRGLDGAGALRGQGPRRQDRHLRRDLPADELRSGEEISRHREHLRRAARQLCAAKHFARGSGTSRSRSSASSSCRSTAWARNRRRKAFHDVCWKNLGDAGFPDRIAWMKAAAAKRTRRWTSRASASTAAARAARAPCARCWRMATSTKSPSPTAAATTTAWTRSGGTSSGWAGPSARITPSSPTSTNAAQAAGQAAADRRRTRPQRGPRLHHAGRERAG